MSLFGRISSPGVTGIGKVSNYKLALYLRTSGAVSMAISPDKTRVAYFLNDMSVWVFNTSDFSLVYAKTATLQIGTSIYSTVGAFDSSNNLALAQGSYTSPVGGGSANDTISFVLYNSTGTRVASRYSVATANNLPQGMTNAFFANSFFYVSGRIINAGRIIKRSATDLAFSADLLRNSSQVYASVNTSENKAYSIVGVSQSFNNVAVTDLSTGTNTYQRHVPATQYSATYANVGAVNSSTQSWMASNYLVEERLEGDYTTASIPSPSITGLTNPKSYTFISNISASNTVVSCYAIYHDSLTALKQASQYSGAWNDFDTRLINTSVVSDLRDNLVVIAGMSYMRLGASSPFTYYYTGAHITIFNTLTNQVVASAVCTSPVSSTVDVETVLDLVGVTVGGTQSFSPTLAITDEYLYIGKYIMQRPKSSLALAAALNFIGGGLTWSAATTTVSSVVVTTTTPTLSATTTTQNDGAYTPTITTYTPTPTINRLPTGQLQYDYVGTGIAVSNQTTYTFNNIPLGAEDPTRRIYLVAIGIQATGTRTINSVTFNGASTTTLASAGGTAQPFMHSVISAPTGSTANIVITFSGVTTAGGVALYRVINQRTELSSVFIENTTNSAVTNSGASRTMNTEADGFALMSLTTNSDISASLATSGWKVDDGYTQVFFGSGNTLTPAGTATYSLTHPASAARFSVTTLRA
jgi:hypothetical protein